MSSVPSVAVDRSRPWIVSPAWDLAYLVLTPLAIVPAVLILGRHWLSTEQIYLAVISFASLGHHLPGFMRAYGDRDLFIRYRWRFLLAPPLVFALALVFTPPASIGRSLGLPWTHLHGLELILMLWGTWHGLMQTYGFMRIYDLRRGDNDRRTARLDQALCAAIFVAGVVFSDTRMFGLAGAMWQTGLPTFGPEALVLVRWIVGAGAVAVGLAYAANLLSRKRRGTPVNGIKLLLAGVTGWFWWYCGRLSTNLLIGVAMFEIYHAVQYNAIVWIYNRRLLERAGARFGPLGFLFRDRVTMLGLYLGAIAAYSSIRFFSAQADDRMFSGDLSNAHQWLIAAFVASSMLHFYYDGFIWKVSERKTRDNLVDEAVAAPPALERIVPAAAHAGKWAALAAIAGVLLVAERRYQSRDAAERQAYERTALARLVPDVPEAAMLASQEALARGDAEAAATLARQAAQERDQSHHAQAELGWALVEAGKYGEARASLERAVELAPLDWHYRTDLGDVCERLGDDRTAEEQFRQAAQLAPAAAEPAERLASLLLRNDRADEALPVLEAVVRRDVQSANAHYMLGLAYLKLADARAAIGPLRRALQLEPAHFQALLQLGDALMALDKPQAAIGPYVKAVELQPETVQARVALADALLHAGDIAEAEAVLRSGLALTPDSGDLTLTLGLVLEQRGRHAEAAELLRKAAAMGLDVGAAVGDR